MLSRTRERITGVYVAHRLRIAFLARYGISGLIGGVIQVLFLFCWVTILGLEESYLLGLMLGFILALLVAFFLQKYWAFRDPDRARIPSQMLSYGAVVLCGLALNALLLAGAKALFGYFSVDFFQGWYLLVQSGIVLVVAVFNFAMNFAFTFRQARRERPWGQ